jgi:hypothetical protein
MSICQHQLCTKRAIYGIEKREYCSQHKKKNMRNINVKTCTCGKIPSFNYSHCKSPMFCVDCKTDDMIQVKSRLCIICSHSRACYGVNKITHCSRCKTDDMINLNRKLCLCGKSIPSFHYPTVVSPKYCKVCKKDGMTDKVNQMCLDCPYNQRGNPKYKYYCTHCFINRFPYDPLASQIRTKSKENQVKVFINEHFDGFVHDKTLYTCQCECVSRRRLDHYKLIEGTFLVIETDENQHKQYDKHDEEIRYDDLYMIHSGKWIYIRFNPDVYIRNGIKYKTSMRIRLMQLKKEIEKQIQRIKDNQNQNLVEIIYLFYDTL